MGSVPAYTITPTTNAVTNESSRKCHPGENVDNTTHIATGFPNICIYPCIARYQ
jgi:hypothetical protein